MEKLATHEFAQVEDLVAGLREWLAVFTQELAHLLPVLAAPLYGLVVIGFGLISIELVGMQGDKKLAVMLSLGGVGQLVPLRLAIHHFAEDDAFCGVRVGANGLEEGEDGLWKALVGEIRRVAYARTVSALTSETGCPGTWAAAAAVAVLIVSLWLEWRFSALRIGIWDNR